MFFQVAVHFLNMLFYIIHLMNVVIRPKEIIELMMSAFMSALYIFPMIVSSLLRVLAYEFMAILLVYRCEQAYKQCDKILEITDVLLVDTKHQSEKKADLLEFRNILLTRPIKFHAAKFFTIDYRTLVSLNSVNINGVPLVRTATNVNQNDSFHEDSKVMNVMTKLHLIGDLETTTFIKCYLQLLEQVNFVNTSYGFRIVMHFVNILFNLVYLLNLVIRPVQILVEVSSPFMSELSVVLAITASLLRALNYEAMAIMLVYRCEQAYKQSDNLLETIDVLLAGTKHHSETKTDLMEFRKLLLTRPIKFHAAKFFTINYRTLVSLNSVVVTYTIIMRENIL
ncbi:unnamed protein product [Arctia plantaginis]|uniref:Gustatory receptor n=1 Tax=Arctia plantaginis TaxID=874455 RepID=A0A8S0Z872_ARCPL|nr:unnamed protein product [Arctia plantaginis]